MLDIFAHSNKLLAFEDVSSTATKKAKSVDTPAKAIAEPVTLEVNPIPKPKKEKTPVKAKEPQVEALPEVRDTSVPKSAKKSKTPAKVKDVETIVPQEAAETPVPKSSKKTKTAAKAEAVENFAPQDASETPASKSLKKTNTPAKAKVTEDTVVQEPIIEKTDRTPGSKAKISRTPAKSTVMQTPVVHKTVVQVVDTPASKLKKTKTPTRSKDTESAVRLIETPASKAKEKTPAKTKVNEQSAHTETDKAPVTKSKKDRTPAKVQPPKETPSKMAAQPIAKSVEKTPAEVEDQAPLALKASKKTPKSAKKSAEKHEPVQQPKEYSTVQEDERGVSDEELDEQTRNLITTIDAEEEDSVQNGVVLFEEGQDVGRIPAISNKQKKQAQKRLAAGSSNAKEETGVLYVGRLPHGFYEHEMRSYFSQFGSIRKLRVARNKQTGRAKHFAFVEFQEASTAEIVAKTMDNYLLFGHILKCSVIPKDQLHDELFKGANKRFKVCFALDRTTSLKLNDR